LVVVVVAIVVVVGTVVVVVDVEVEVVEGRLIVVDVAAEGAQPVTSRRIAASPCRMKSTVTTSGR
jgi:hypothetical protein